MLETKMQVRRIQSHKMNDRICFSLHVRHNNINQDQTFRNVNDCLYFAKRLNDQPEIPFPMTRQKRLQSIASPCLNVCKIKNNICIGCQRTLEQISNWSKMTDEERKKIMQS
jgi:uncharacterized protein